VYQGQITLENWATQISPGVYENLTHDVSEVDQELEFLVQNSQPSAFVTAPVLSSSGVLSFETKPDFAGLVTLSVLLRDNGGRLHGGIDSSDEVSFVFEVMAREEVYNANWPADGKVLQAIESSGSNFYPSFIHMPDLEIGAQARNLTYRVNVAAFSEYFSIQPSVTVHGTMWFSLLPHVFGNVSGTNELIEYGPAGSTSHGIFPFRIEVLPVNNAPYFVIAPDATWSSGKFAQNTLFVDEDSCPGQGDPCTFPNFIEHMGPGPENNFVSSLGRADSWAELDQELTFEVTVQGTEDSVVFDAEINQEGTLSFFLKDHRNGQVRVVIILRDSGGTDRAGVEHSTQTFTISVAPVNDAPYFSIACPASSGTDESGSGSGSEGTGSMSGSGIGVSSAPRV